MEIWEIKLTHFSTCTCFLWILIGSLDSLCSLWFAGVITWAYLYWVVFCMHFTRILRACRCYNSFDRCCLTLNWKPLKLQLLLTSSSRGEFDRAEPLLVDAYKMYKHEKWSLLATQCLVQLAQCQKQLKHMDKYLIHRRVERFSVRKLNWLLEG